MRVVLRNTGGPYRSIDPETGEHLKIQPGVIADVSAGKAAQMLADYPGHFEVLENAIPSEATNTAPNVLDGSLVEPYELAPAPRRRKGTGRKPRARKATTPKE
ncbi:MAG: hypothetical protein GYA36_23015 [Veillonellaceae bacterium]|nr:hypothetical protein [Veillonellaceae bacterium]